MAWTEAPNLPDEKSVEGAAPKSPQTHLSWQFQCDSAKCGTPQVWNVSWVLKCVVINREIHFKFRLMPIFHLSRCCGYRCFLAERLNAFNEVYLHNDYCFFFRPIVYISFTAELNSGMLQTAGASGLLFLTRLAQGPHLSSSLHQNYYVSWYHQGSLRCLRWHLPLFSHFPSHHYS